MNAFEFLQTNICLKINFKTMFYWICMPYGAKSILNSSLFSYRHDFPALLKFKIEKKNSPNWTKNNNKDPDQLQLIT